MALAWRPIDLDTAAEDDPRAPLWAALQRGADLPDLPTARPTWHAHAACTGRSEVMFSTSRAAVAEAKALCRRCPAMERCARDALERGERFGTWGGLSEDDRRAFHASGRAGRLGLPRR